MNYCRYCHMETNGDIPDDRANLFFEKFQVPNEIEITIERKGSILPEQMKASLKIEGDTDAIIINNRLCATVSFPVFAEDGELDDYNTKDFEVEINYCPMCGRKLSKK